MTMIQLIACIGMIAGLFNLIKFPQRGVCLYKCGNERYLLEVHAPAYKEKLFGTAGGR